MPRAFSSRREDSHPRYFPALPRAARQRLGAPANMKLPQDDPSVNQASRHALILLLARKKAKAVIKFEEQAAEPTP